MRRVFGTPTPYAFARILCIAFPLTTMLSFAGAREPTATAHVVPGRSTQESPLPGEVTSPPTSADWDKVDDAISKLPAVDAGRVREQIGYRPPTPPAQNPQPKRTFVIIRAGHSGATTSTHIGVRLSGSVEVLAATLLHETIHGEIEDTPDDDFPDTDGDGTGDRPSAECEEAAAWAADVNRQVAMHCEAPLVLLPQYRVPTCEEIKNSWHNFRVHSLLCDGNQGGYTNFGEACNVTDQDGNGQPEIPCCP